MRTNFSTSIKYILLILFSAVFTVRAQNSWKMHVIDNSFSGADGVKLADANNDGLEDIATGWEEGGITKIYFHPGFN
ncbi:MAG TPA: hypothetical protein PLC80_19550, partial [Draconibacterium sp.]|nr:hypothetical protein [Draconibacterium sp.]